MRNAFVIAGIFALATALSPSATLAQGNSASGMQASGSASMQPTNVKAKSKISANTAGTKSLARADVAAGTHGLKGRNNARTHGANKPGFCPPGQAKKPGLGSRFQC
jgi:hypothetical protein